MFQIFIKMFQKKVVTFGLIQKLFNFTLVLIQKLFNFALGLKQKYYGTHCNRKT